MNLLLTHFLGISLAEGQHVAAPEPWVVGEGLDCVQAAFDIQRKDVLARTVVVTL